MKRLFIILSVILSTGLFGIGKEGGSGAAVVCRQGRAISSARLLDLFEARLDTRLLGLGVKVPLLTDDYTRQIDHALEKLQRLSPDFAAQVSEALQPILSSPISIPTGLRLAPGFDTETLALPPGCDLELVGKYMNDTLFRDENLLRSLDSETDRAAFYLHEAIYKVYRAQYGRLVFQTSTSTMTLNDTSRIARRAVGYLFSDREPAPALEGLPAGSRHCRNAFLDFYLAPDGEIHFARLGVPVLSRTVATKGVLQTEFPLLGDKVGFRFDPPSASSRGSAETSGGFLRIPSAVLECSE